jgi:tetratricopeptide (TPR) repeat protein
MIFSRRRRGLKIAKNTVVIAVAFALTFCFAADLFSQETKQGDTKKLNPTLENGIGLYKHENFDEALGVLKQARLEEPQSTLAAYYLGLTYKQMQNYKDAIPPLRDAVTIAPKIKGALIELIDCLYQTDQLEEANKWIAEAETEGIRPAQTAFLKGMVLMKEEKSDAAISSFENAKALDQSMTQAADYQIATEYLKTGKFANAKSVFQQLTLVDPNSTMANFANTYMDAIARREEAMKPFRVSAGIYWQYDDNVVLLPSDSTVATNITDKADSREVVTANAEYKQRINDVFDIKAQYFLYWAKQNDLGFYDTLSNTFVLQPDVTLKGGGLLTFPTAYNITRVNDKAYLSSPSTNAVYNFMVGNHNMGQAYIKYAYKDYMWAPTIDDEDRTGNDLGGGFGWYFFFMKNRGFINLRYSILKEWTTGQNWDNWENDVNATLLVPVLDKLNVTLSGGTSFQNFDNSNTIFHVTRHDQVYTISALAAYKIYKDSEIQLQYTFVRDSSNIKVYDYSRNIFSAGVEIKF